MTPAPHDRWLGGRLSLRQPANGHRVGTDAALLAAALSAPGPTLADVGAGVGAVGLACALRAPSANVSLVERDPDVADLARANVDANHLADRVRIVMADVEAAARRREAGLLDGSMHAVLTNPPFFSSREVRASPDPLRAGAHVMTGTLERWIAACAALLQPHGVFAMIHRADALSECLAAAQGRLGELIVLPVFAREGACATRILLRGRKGSRAKPSIAPGLILHGADGAFTAQAQALHRGEAWLDWGT